MAQNINKVTISETLTDEDYLIGSVNNKLRRVPTSFFANAVDSRIGELENDTNVLEARMDTFTALEDGSTTGDAELQDIRVGADGVTYDTAGNAVREQFSEKLNKNFTNISTPVKMTYEDGCYRNSQYEVIFTVEKDGITTIKVENVTAGEKYRLKTYHSVEEVYYNYFVFETSTIGVSAIDVNNLAQYVECIDTENYEYIFTIPDGCVTFYSACGTGLESEVIIERLDEFNISMLRLSTENFPQRCIPRYALEYEEYTHNIYESIAKPFDFTGKTICAFGDSITVGVTSPNLEVTEDSYIKLFASKHNMTLTNKAVSGSTLCEYWQTQSCTPIYQKIADETEQYDFIFIAGGTNDYGTGRTVGVYGDTEVSTVYGAMQNICDVLKENHSNSTVIFITPINRTKEATESIASLDEYRKAIFEVATANGFNVVDGADLGLPSCQGGWNNTMIADNDGCHPTTLGHRLYFNGLCGKLN